MATTLNTSTYRDFDLQILESTIQGAFAQKDAFIGSLLQSSGALSVSGTMPGQGANVIGNTITMPYFGTVGDFTALAEGDSGTPNAIYKTNETATISRTYLGVSMSTWARYADTDDAYNEMARQVVVATRREMDKRALTEAVTTELVYDVYSASLPKFLDFDTVVEARAAFGDEAEDVVAMAVHSRTYADLLKLKDSAGHPLAVLNGVAGDRIPTFNGLPLVVSDKMPLTGSSMGTVTSAGTGSEPVATLAGTPTGPWDLRIRVASGTALATAKINFSTNGGRTWSGDITTLAAAAPLALIDPNKDSIVGNNGTTGITVAFAGDFANVDNTYSAKAVLKASSLIIKRGAMAVWYNQAALAPKFDVNIRQDSQEIALHMYAAACLYRRANGGTKPGAVLVNHNLSGFTGA